MRVMAAIFALMFSLVACADENSQAASGQVYKAGEHFVELDNPVRTQNPDKIEVTEVFWYGCGHCFTFEPLVHKWADSLPEDVDFQRSPAMWNILMETHARAFYTAKALGVLEQLHQPLFNALNIERKRLADEDELAEFFAGHGVDKTKFEKAYNSFGVSSQVKQANSRARSYKITGTPEMVVNGKYRITAKMAGGQAGMLKVADFLIAKIRAEQG